MVVQVFDLCLTCLWSMWDVPCVSMLWFISDAIVASSTTITVLDPLHLLRFQNLRILRTNILYFCSCLLFWILFTQNTVLHKKHKTPHSRMEQSMRLFKQKTQQNTEILARHQTTVSIMPASIQHIVPKSFQKGNLKWMKFHAQSKSLESIYNC